MGNLNIEFNLKFENIEKEFDELEELINSVEVISDTKLYNFYKKKWNKIFKVSNLFKEYKSNEQKLNNDKNLLFEEKDDEFKKILKDEIQSLEEIQGEIFSQLKLELKNLENSKDEIVQIEITLKNGDREKIVILKSLFENYAQINNQSIKIERQTETNLILIISGEDAFGDLFIFMGNSKIIEFGKESIFTVSVIEIKNFKVELNIDDVEIETLKSGGAGGQHINKTESAIRLIHKPTGISVVCQDERSQLMNKQRAFENLTNKLQEYYSQKAQKDIEIQRKNNKNALFSSTPTTIFDFDKNNFYCYKTKQNYNLKEILEGKLKIIARDII